MKVSRNWLRKYTKLPERDELLVQKIGSQLGGVDATISLGERYKGIQAVKIVSCLKHPNADNLQVCSLDTGGAAAHVGLANEEGYVQVVCGALNVRMGQTAVWIPPGVVVPSTRENEPFKIESRDIRGIKSSGMLASPKELGFSDDHQGILLLPSDVTPGTPLTDIYELNDLIIDIENKMFTHRPDCFGMLGIAREVAGITDVAFHSPEWYLSPLDLPPAEESAALPIEISNVADELAPRFMGIVIKGVKIGPSPVGLQSYLSRLGVKPINNVVDITNYYMLLTAQPLHAYDYDKLKAVDGLHNTACLTVRTAVEGETLRLLGDKEVKLTNDDVVIASRTRPVGLAGIMGGAETEVDATTTNIMLECANFDMYAIRRTAMRLGLFTEAAIRFTKQQSPLQNDRVLHKAAQDILKSTGGKIASKVYDEQGKLPTVGSVQVTTSFINDRLGLQLTTDAIVKTLANVEFNVATEGETLRVDAPFWRTDIHIEEDIVEEVGRLIGYDHLSVELPVRNIQPAAKNKPLELKDWVRDTLKQAGTNEVLTYTFVHGNLLEKCGQDAKLAFELGNALSPDLQFYRLSLTPSLLEKTHTNLKAGYREFALFEINKTHCKQEVDKDGLPKESERIAWVSAADKTAVAKYYGAPFYQARYTLEFLLQRAGLATFYSLVPLSDYKPASESENQLLVPYEPQRSAVVLGSEKQILGVVGEFTARVRRQMKLPAFLSGFELYLEPLMKTKQSPQYVSLSRFPSTEQDISFRVSPDTVYGVLQRTMEESLAKAKSNHGYRFTLSPLDIYISEDKQEKHVAFRIRLTHPQRTLTIDETNRLLDELAQNMQQTHQAERL